MKTRIVIEIETTPQKVFMENIEDEQEIEDHMDDLRKEIGDDAYDDMHWEQIGRELEKRGKVKLETPEQVDRMFHHWVTMYVMRKINNEEILEDLIDQPGYDMDTFEELEDFNNMKIKVTVE